MGFSQLFSSISTFFFTSPRFFPRFSPPKRSRAIVPRGFHDFIDSSGLAEELSDAEVTAFQERLMEEMEAEKSLGRINTYYYHF